MTRTNQGGSVLGFVVVAVIMAGLLIGGVYAMRQMTAEPQQKLEPSKTATENKPSTDQKNQETPSAENKQAEEPKDDTQNPSEDSSKQQATGELPKTGPGESLLGTIIVLAALSGTVASYARSRRLELPL